MASSGFSRRTVKRSGWTSIRTTVQPTDYRSLAKLEHFIICYQRLDCLQSLPPSAIGIVGGLTAGEKSRDR